MRSLSGDDVDVAGLSSTSNPNQKNNKKKNDKNEVVCRVLNKIRSLDTPAATLDIHKPNITDNVTYIIRPVWNNTHLLIYLLSLCLPTTEQLFLQAVYRYNLPPSVNGSIASDRMVRRVNVLAPRVRSHVLL